jgi:hypothetical protein
MKLKKWSKLKKLMKIVVNYKIVEEVFGPFLGGFSHQGVARVKRSASGLNGRYFKSGAQISGQSLCTRFRGEFSHLSSRMQFAVFLKRAL